jgi:hypothetical protein
MDGLVVYEELKLDDLPLRADFSQVLLMCFDAQVTHTAGMLWDFAACCTSGLHRDQSRGFFCG